jgi:hypothetical protein
VRAAASKLDWDKVIEGNQDNKQADTDPEAPADQFLFHRQQRFDRRCVDFILEFWLRHGFSLKLAGQRRFEAAEEQP